MNLEIANRLVELRHNAGYSQEDLAARLNVSRQAVSKWERAESSPDTDNLISLATLYGVSLDALLLNQGGAATQTAPPPQAEPYYEEDYDAASAQWDDYDRAHRLWLRKRLLVFPYPVLVTMVYLLLGFMFGWWHPAWILYLSIPIYYCVVGGMMK